MRQSHPSLSAAGLIVGIASVALVAFQPSSTVAGAAGLSGRQTGSAGKTAALVGSRLAVDSLSDSDSVPGPASGGGAPGPGSLTIALDSLHLTPPPVHHPAPRVTVPLPTAPAHPVAVPAPTTPPTSVPVTPAAAPAPPPAATASPAAAPSPAPAPAAPRLPAPAPAPAPAPGAPSAAVWAELRECESGDNYTIDTGDGYYGAYQFSAQTWHGLGYPGLPNQAPPAVQDQAAQTLWNLRGWEPWPGCTAKLGL